MFSIIIIKHNSSDVTLASRVNQSNLIPLSQKIIKTKKCQPDAGDRPDLIQTAPVPSGRPSRQKIKINRTKKLKKFKIKLLVECYSSEKSQDNKIDPSVSNHHKNKKVSV